MAGSNARYALIDADSILYAVALQSEGVIKGKNGEPDEHFLIKDGEECYREVVYRLERLVQEVGAEDALICLTPPGKCFRYGLLESYKGNRLTIRRPDILRPLQAMVAERKPFRVLSVRGLEADDICGISSTSLQKASLREPVIVSIDKDMLQIPGLNYSPMAAARAGTVGVVNEVTEEEGERMHLYQTLIGDAVDNYTGCPGVGPKKANKILDEMISTHGQLDWAFVVRAFQLKGLSAEYALTQARVARILRDTDWNPNTKEVALWTPARSVYGQCSPKVKTQLGASVQDSMDIASEAMAVPTKAILDDRLGATLH